jgi:hypothetical protein
MNIATQVASRVHHFRAIKHSNRRGGVGQRK